MEVKYTFDKLGMPLGALPGATALLAKAMRERSAVKCMTADSGVEMQAGTDPARRGGITMRGRWRSEALRAVPPSSWGNLLSPLLFIPSEITIPSDFIYTVRPECRSIAEFAAWNLFYSACRRDPVYHVVDVRSKTSTKWVKAVWRHYILAMKESTGALVFHRKTDEVLDLILTDAHLAVLAHDHPLLAAGAADLRRAALSPVEMRVAPMCAAEFHGLRSRAMAFFQ